MEHERDKQTEREREKRERGREEKQRERETKPERRGGEPRCERDARLYENTHGDSRRANGFCEKTSTAAKWQGQGRQIFLGYFPGLAAILVTSSVLTSRE